MMLATEFPGLRNGYAAVLPPGPNCGRPMYLAHYAALGRACGLVRVQMRRMRSVAERICRRAPSRLVCG
jgi:hypothetical protein